MESTLYTATMSNKLYISLAIIYGSGSSAPAQ